MAAHLSPLPVSKVLMLWVLMASWTAASAAPPTTAPTTLPVATFLPASAPADMEAANAQARKALGKQIPKLELPNVPFKDVVELVRTVGGVNIYVNWPGLQAAAVEKDTRVNLSLQNTTFAKVLELVLYDLSANARVTYVIKDGVVLISTRDDLSKNPETRFHYVGDIVHEMASIEFANPILKLPQERRCFCDVVFTNASLFMDSLKGVVDKDSWEPAGTIGSMKLVGDDLLVKQTIENQEAVAKMLDQVRASVESKRVGLGLAVVRLGANQAVKDLREALKDARDVGSVLTAGADKGAWTLDRNRLEQTLLRKSTRFEMSSGKDFLGYDVNVTPLERRDEKLLVSVDFSSRWQNSADEISSNKDSVRVTVPAGSCQLIELTQPGKSGAIVLVVSWQQQKK